MEYLRQCDGISTGHASLTGEVYYTWPGGARREAREGGGEGVREGGEKERREEGKGRGGRGEGGREKGGGGEGKRGEEKGGKGGETKEGEGRRTCKKE